MNPNMMRAWLSEQAKKAPVSPAQIQRKRLGVSESVYGLREGRFDDCEKCREAAKRGLKPTVDCDKLCKGEKEDAAQYTQREYPNGFRGGLKEGFFTAAPKSNTGAQQPVSSSKSSLINSGQGSVQQRSGQPITSVTPQSSTIDYQSRAKKAFADSTEVIQYDQKWDPKTRRTVRTKRRLSPAEIQAQGWDDPNKRGFGSMFQGMEAGGMEAIKNFPQNMSRDIYNAMAWSRQPFRLGVGESRPMW